MGHGALQLLSFYTNTPVRGWAYAPGAEHGACARAGSPPPPPSKVTCSSNSNDFCDCKDDCGTSFCQCAAALACCGDGKSKCSNHEPSLWTHEGGAHPATSVLWLAMARRPRFRARAELGSTMFTSELAVFLNKFQPSRDPRQAGAEHGAAAVF